MLLYRVESGNFRQNSLKVPSKVLKNFPRRHSFEDWSLLLRLNLRFSYRTSLHDEISGFLTRSRCQLSAKFANGRTNVRTVQLHPRSKLLSPSRFLRRQMAVPSFRQISRGNSGRLPEERWAGEGGGALLENLKKQRRRKLRKLDGNCGSSCWKRCRANSIIRTPERLQLCGSCCVCNWGGG